MGLTKAQVLNEFETAWADGAAARDGGVFEERAERVTRQLLPADREATVSVLRDWMQGAQGPTALVAVKLAERFELLELLDDIRDLDTRICGEQVLLPYYARWTKRAIASLSTAGR